jgi:Acyl-protein synthetase, LuxE
VDLSVANAADLDERILQLIQTPQTDDATFDRLAVDVFAYQYACNQAYRRYCDRHERTPRTARRWQDVPAIPTSAFGEVRLACFPPGDAKLTFLSSGTTGGSVKRSRHELDTATLYDASLLAHFRACVLPDAATMRMLVFAPSIAEAPHSSLSYMLSTLGRTLGTERDGFFIRGEELEFDAARSALQTATEPVLVIGTAFAFVHFFERCFKDGLRFALPLGSRVVETGGFKGRSREVPRDELYAWFSELLGVPRVMCVSEYGMCELGSQWYDANLADHVAGRAPRERVKIGPRWARTSVVDPVSGLPVEDDREGLLQVFDLCNRGSVAAVLTGDLARAVPGGFELIGRFPGAPPKGCSIAIDALLDHGAAR